MLLHYLFSGPSISSVGQIRRNVGSSSPFFCDFDESFPKVTNTTFQIIGKVSQFMNRNQVSGFLHNNRPT